MASRILTPLEVAGLKRDAADDDIKNLILTVEDAWAERDEYQRLIDKVWDKFGEMSQIIRATMRKK